MYESSSFVRVELVLIEFVCFLFLILVNRDQIQWKMSHDGVFSDIIRNSNSNNESKLNVISRKPVIFNSMEFQMDKNCEPIRIQLGFLRFMWFKDHKILNHSIFAEFEFYSSQDRL